MGKSAIFNGYIYMFVYQRVLFFQKKNMKQLIKQTEYMEILMS